MPVYQPWKDLELEITFENHLPVTLVLKRPRMDLGKFYEPAEVMLEWGENFKLISFLFMATDLAHSILETFANEYRTTYGCEVLRLDEESDAYKSPFSLKFCPVSCKKNEKPALRTM